MTNLPSIVLSAPAYDINITAVLSFLILCLTAAGTIIKIWGNKKVVRKENELPGNTPLCKQHKENVERVEKLVEINGNRDTELNAIVNKLNTELQVLKNEHNLSIKDVQETKTRTLEITNRMEELLKELDKWINFDNN